MKTRITLLVALLSIAAVAETARHVPASHQLEPEQLAKLLKTEKPLVLMVGPKFMYSQAHIPGAEYVGMASENAGRKALRERVAKLPKTQAVVLYCGCCPWTFCPNIAPAFNELQSLGFKNVKVLHLEQNFAADWVDKAYPVQRSAPAGK